MLLSKECKYFVFDPADYSPSQYKDLHFVLSDALLYYIKKLKGPHPAGIEKWIPRTHFPCHKQPVGTLYCGYYVCEIIRSLGSYTTDPERFQGTSIDRSLQEVDLLKIVGEICHFIMREVINTIGEYVHPEKELFTEDKYASLRDWHLEEYHISK